MSMQATWTFPGREIVPRGQLPTRVANNPDPEERIIQKILAQMNSRQHRAAQQSSTTSMSRSHSASRLRPRKDVEVPCYPKDSCLRHSTMTRTKSWRFGPQPGVMRIVIKHAYGIEVADLRGTSDPYVVARCGGQESKTTVMRKTLDPVWNEVLDFHGFLDDFLLSDLELTLYDWDGDSMGSDDSLGDMKLLLDDELRLQKGLAGPKEYIQAWSTQGEVVFTVEWRPDDRGSTGGTPKTLLRDSNERLKVPVFLPHKFDFVQTTYERFSANPPPSTTTVPYFKIHDPIPRITYGAPVPRTEHIPTTLKVAPIKPRLGAAPPPRFDFGPSASEPKLSRPPSASVFIPQAFDPPWMQVRTTDGFVDRKLFL